MKKRNLLRKSLLTLITAIMLLSTACKTDDISKDLNNNIGLEYVNSIISSTFGYGDCIMVKYTYTNKNTTDSCFEWNFDINAYQDGIRLEHAYLDDIDMYGDFKDYANNNLDTIIAPGTTITICDVFKLYNNTSNITIKLSENFDSEAILTNVIEPLELISPVTVNIAYKRRYTYDNESHWFYIVKYSFTNTSDIPKSFDDAFDVYAITYGQNDYIPNTLERSINITQQLSNSIDISLHKLESSQKIINSGDKIYVYLLFELISDSSSYYKDLEVSIYEKNTDNLKCLHYFEESDFY